MYFKYGNYQHPAGEVQLVSYTKRRMKSKRNRLMFIRHTMEIMGEICETGQSNIKTTLEAMEAEYNQDFGDAVLYHDDGTMSAHRMINSLSINGVRVLTFDYPKGDKSEYATGRTFRAVLQADYEVEEDSIYSFTETVSQLGTTASAWELVPHFTGTPTTRTIYQYTTQKIVQEGYVVGYNGWPIVPTAILPTAFEHADQRMVVRSSPMFLNKYKKFFYPLRYRYVFESTVSQSVTPAEDYH